MLGCHCFVPSWTKDRVSDNYFVLALEKVSFVGNSVTFLHQSQHQATGKSSDGTVINQARSKARLVPLIDTSCKNRVSWHYNSYAHTRSNDPPTSSPPSANPTKLIITQRRRRTNPIRGFQMFAVECPVKIGRKTMLWGRSSGLALMILKALANG